MRRLSIFLVFILLVSLGTGVIPVKAQSAWASSYADWQYRRPITITEQSGKDLTDFQVKITLDSSNFDFSKAKADGSDIRFADANGNPLSYYIESWDSTNKKAVIWVKVPSIPASSSVTIYMYYGNTQATSESNPRNVFDFFDDFETWSGWTQYGSGVVSQSSDYMHDGQHSLKKDSNGDPNGGYKAIGTTLGRDIILEAWTYRESSPGANANRFGLIDDNGNGYGIYLDDHASVLGIDKRSSYSATTSAKVSITSSDKKWHFTQIIITDTQVIVKAEDDNGNLISTSLEDTSYNSFTRVYVFGGYPYYVDVMRIRKYASTEPSVSVGAEETSTGTSYTITLSLKDDSGNPLSDVSITITDSNGNTVLSGTYNDGDSISIASTGDYTIKASKDHYISDSTTVSITSDTTSYTATLTLVEVPAPSISYSPNTIRVGDKVTATASAPAKEGHTWKYQYRFEDGNGNILQDWSSTNTYTIPSSLAHGTLVIKARTVDAATGVTSVESSISVNIANSPPTVQLTVEPTVVLVGDTITATATATDVDGDTLSQPEYKFIDATTGETLQDWSLTNTYTVQSASNGHVITVLARVYDGYEYGTASANVNVGEPPKPTPGEYALSFGGAGYGTTTPINSNFLSVVVFFKATNITGEHSILDARKWGDNFGGWNLRVENGYLSWRVVYNNSGNYAEEHVDIPLQANKTYLAICTFDGHTLRLDLNGELKEQTVANALPQPTDSKLWIGIYRTGTSGYFAGEIYSIIVYNRSLNNSEIQQIYSSPLKPPQNGLTLWYAPDSVNTTNKMWLDKSGNDHIANMNGIIIKRINTIKVSYYDVKTDTLLSPMIVKVSLLKTSSTLFPSLLVLPPNETITLNISATNYKSRVMTIPTNINSLAVYLSPATSNSNEIYTPSTTPQAPTGEIRPKEDYGIWGVDPGAKFIVGNWSQAFSEFWHLNNLYALVLPLIFTTGLIGTAWIVTRSPLVVVGVTAISATFFGMIGVPLKLAVISPLAAFFLFALTWIGWDFYKRFERG